jgi:hypothetical protein
MPCVELKVIYSFDYSSFLSKELESKAQKTLSNFLGFVRQSFDTLLEQGQALQEIYYDCQVKCPNGKKIFDGWLASDDFGASRYIAQSAMDIYAWFEKLPRKVQLLVRQNVQKWSVSALRQLTKVSQDLVKELVRTGKKTAAQIKTVSEKNKNDKEAGELQVDDYLQNQDCNTKHLFKSNQIKSNQIQPETAQSTVQNISTEMFTQAQVEQKIAEALAKRDKEKAEEELKRFVEIRDAALEAAKEELLEAQQHTNRLAQAKQELAQQLMAKERELEELRSLQARNQQLEERVAHLEKALEDSNINRWGNTFNEQAAKVVNLELEKTITPLMSEVERLNALLETRSQELVKLQAINTQQQEELSVLQQQSVSKSSEILAEFGEIGERFGWVGWSRRGYRTTSGILHTGLSAISAFVSDLTREYQYQQEVAL